MTPDPKGHVIPLGFGGTLTITEHDDAYQATVDTEGVHVSFGMTALDIWQGRMVFNDILVGRLQEIKEAPTPLGRAHQDDGSACHEPTFCLRDHVRTPIAERGE